MNHTHKTLRALDSGAGTIRCVLLGGLITLAAAPPLHAQSNPVANPGAEAGNMNGWTIDGNGGDGWSAGVDSLVHSGTHAFSTSWDWDTRHEVIDLLAAGFSAAQLDAAPSITIGEWVGTRSDDGGYVFLKFQLLDGNHNPLSGGTWQFGTMNNSIHFPANTLYTNISHTFSNYGRGVRYIYFGDGGADENIWSGHYGPRFDDAYVTVDINPVVNPGAETGNMNGWIVDDNGFVDGGWSATFDSLVHSGTHAFSTTWEWSTRHQVIDLLAAGYSAAQLDAAPPITIGEWVATRNNGDYALNFQLLDGNQTPLSGGTWQSGSVFISSGTPYTKVFHTFSGYGAGLRYIYFGDGGVDLGFWSGHYGPHFDDAYVTVADISTPWSDATDLGSGWKRSSWFGDFNVDYYPWIYHAQHGWMYVFGTDPGSIWLYNQTGNMGFLWTSSAVYPWLWSDAKGTWLYYAKGSHAPRWLFNWNAQKWGSHNP